MPMLMPVIKPMCPDAVSSGSRLHKLYRKIIYISDNPTVHTNKKDRKAARAEGPTAEPRQELLYLRRRRDVILFRG